MRIDQISQINLDTVALSELRWMYGTGISTATGSRKAGNYKPGYRNGVMTAIGDIQEDIWYQVAEHIARRDGEEWLVTALNEWENAHNYASKSKKDLYHDALQSYSYRLFDDPQWVHYIPFNLAYRAEVLKQAQIVSVVNTCCGKPGDVTQQQIDRAYDGKIACPHCGRWSTFCVIGGKSGLPWEEYGFFPEGNNKDDGYAT